MSHASHDALSNANHSVTQMSISSVLIALRNWLVKANAVYRQRRQLAELVAELDARTLRDVGISPDDARRESSRPFWDHAR